MNVLTDYLKEKYPEHTEREILQAYAPYRVCPLGAHSDHQHGKVTGFALDQGVSLAFVPSPNGVVALDSEDFDGHVEFHVQDIPKKQGNWGDYARAAAFALQTKYVVTVGIKGSVSGSLPIGGLSSSAAVLLCYLSAIAKVNDITLSSNELIELSFYAETSYVGISVGTLDMSCEVLCRQNELLYLDTQNNCHQSLKPSPSLPDFEIAVFYSGVSRNLGSGFNVRVDEAKTAAYCLKAYAGLPYGTLSDTHLREVPREAFDAHHHLLPDNMQKRARHFFTELERTEQGAKAWQAGDMQTFGRLMFESGQSSIYNWETGSPELIAIYNAMKEIEGIYGGRFSGAGFKGCCIALINPSFKQEIATQMTQRYLAQFPQYQNSFSIHFCKTDNGVRIV